jgi:putative ABC transport system permease protein
MLSNPYRLVLRFDMSRDSFLSKYEGHPEAVMFTDLTHRLRSLIRRRTVEQDLARGVRLLDDLGNDLRYAVRQARRSPGFAVIAVLWRGLGIGANTSMFSALNSVLFRPLPVADPARLVMLSRGTSANFSYPDFQDLQERGRLLSGLTASFPMESDLEVEGVSEFVAAEVVSANYGPVVGVTPTLGRWFTSETEPIAVISYAVWQNRFGGSANILGR